MVAGGEHFQDRASICVADRPAQSAYNGRYPHAPFVVERGVSDPALGDLPLGALIASETQLGAVAEVRAAFKEEGTEVSVDA